MIILIRYLSNKWHANRYMILFMKLNKIKLFIIKAPICSERLTLILLFKEIKFYYYSFALHIIVFQLCDL